MKLKKLVVSLLTGVIILGNTVPAIAAGWSGKVTASGSSAILPLAKAAANEFMDKNPDAEVSIQGGGSFTGLKQVAEGSVDIGNSDVPVDGTDYANSGLVGYKVAVAPFVIIVNKSNKVSNLSQQQLIDIFTGKVTNWKQVGGADKEITIIGRSSTSGSRATIKRTILKGQEFTDKATSQSSTGAVRTAVGSTEGGIGYVDAAYIDSSIKVLKYNNVPYNAANVINGKYPVWTYEYMYTKGAATGIVKGYIDSIQASGFQGYHVERLGFIPLTKMAGKKAPTEVKKSQTATVKTTTANIRKSADAKSSVVKVAKKGQKFTVVAKVNSSWYKVKVTSSTYGYVAASQVTVK